MLFKNKKKEIEKQVNQLCDYVLELIDKNDWMELYSFAKLIETETIKELNKHSSQITEEEIVVAEVIKLMSETVQKLTKKIQKEIDG